MVVVIAEHPVRPGARRQQRLVASTSAAIVPRVPGQLNQLKVERQVRALEVLARSRPSAARSADRSRRPACARRTVEQPAQLGDNLVYFGPVARVDRQQDRGQPAGPAGSSGLGGLSRNSVVLDQSQITSTRKPSTPRSSQKRSTPSIAARRPGCASSGRAAFGRKACSSTGRSLMSQSQAPPPNCGQPVIRRPAARRWIAPDIPVPLGAVARRSRLQEPGVLVRRVIGHEIENDLQAAPCASATSVSKSSRVPNIGSISV